MKDLTFVKFSLSNQQGPLIKIYDTSFEFNDELVHYTTGFMLLLQLVIKWLLTTPGTDIISPSLGGGLNQISGVPPSSVSEIAFNVSQSILACEDQIKKYQTGRKYPLDEQLQKLEIDPDRGIVKNDDHSWEINLIISSKGNNYMKVGVNV
jgi:hypothetical protein